MRIIFTGANIEVTDALREITTEKLGKLDKYFEEDIADIRVVYIVEKDREIVEITLNIPGGTILRAEEFSDDLYTSIDKAVDVLEGQMSKYKTKLQDRYQNKGTIRFENIKPLKKEEDDDGPKIVRTKRFDMKPMMEEEAILQMELLTHNFFVFMNVDSGDINVLYKRNDGNYGLIQPEI